MMIINFQSVPSYNTGLYKLSVDMVLPTVSSANDTVLNHFNER